MKTDCRRFEKHLVNAVYDDLGPDERTMLQAHLASCEDCEKQMGELRATLQIMSKRTRKEPDWSRFDAELSKKISRPQAPSPPRLVFQVAAAIVLVLLGILIGRMNLRDPDSSPVQTAKEQKQSPQILPVAARTEKFLQKSEVLLLALVNTPEGLNVNDSRRVSQGLIREATDLQEELSASDQKRLGRLVSELEVILLQIANLEASQDAPGIELLKDGVDSSSILLKINLEQARITESKSDVRGSQL